jgi:signal transduction histidine kinase
MKFTIALIWILFLPLFGFATRDSLSVDSLNKKSFGFIVKGEFPKADSASQEALKLSESIHYKKGIMYAATNLGVIAWYQDNSPRAFQYYLRSLKVAEEMSDKKLISKACVNIGLVYSTEKEYDKALEYYLRAIKLKEEVKDTKGFTRVLNNVARLYASQNDFQNAGIYYKRSYERALADKDTAMIALDLMDIGSLDMTQGDTASALKNYEASLRMADGRDKVLTPNIKCKIATVFILQKKHKEAEALLKSGLEGAIETTDLDIQSELNQKLSELYALRNDWALSYVHYKKHSELKDSIFNAKKTKELVRSEMNYEFDKKQAIEKIEQEKKDLVAAEELKQNKLQRNYLIIGFILLFMVGFLVVRAYQQKQKVLMEESKRKQIEAELEIHRNLQKERDRISRDLHDNVGSHLTYIISQLDYTSALLPQSETKVQDKLQGMRSDSRELMQMLRETIWAIKKEKISLNEFNEKVRELLSRYHANLPGIQFRFNCDESTGNKTELQPVQSLNLFRIIQEGLNNVIKHAGAKNVNITVALPKTDTLLLTIEDDGKGFLGNASKEQYGLKNMEARAKEMNGELAITSEINKGTKLNARIHLN